MFLKLKTLHFLDLIHIAIFVCVQQKKSITCKVLHSTAHGFSHSIHCHTVIYIRRALQSETEHIRSNYKQSNSYI